MSAESTDGDVVKLKKELRKDIRGKLKALTVQEISEQSDKVWNRLFELPEYQAAKSVGLFLSMPSGEISTQAVLRDASRRGKDIYVPQVGKNFEQADMDLLRAPKADTYADGKLFYDDWPRNKWQIPEPPEDLALVAAKPGEIDLLVVPGLAFDSNGNRLGQGKGYYDRFIARMKQPPAAAPYLVAVGLSCSKVAGKIPVNDYDQRMDLVLLPGDTISPQKQK